MTKIVELNDAALDGVQGGFLLEVSGIKMSDPTVDTFTATDDLWKVKGQSPKTKEFYEGWPIK